jgi:DNA-binding PadR family transcriptional regulator
VADTNRTAPPGLFSKPTDDRLLHYVRGGHIIDAVDGSPPLTAAVFSILFALADGEKHGYQIMKQVRRDTHDAVKMGTGTLYGSIKRMLADGLIAEAGNRPDPALDDERRRYYRATDRGRRVLAAELKRYSEVLSIARRRKLMPKLSPSQAT